MSGLWYILYKNSVQPIRREHGKKNKEERLCVVNVFWVAHRLSMQAKKSRVYLMGRCLTHTSSPYVYAEHNYNPNREERTKKEEAFFNVKYMGERTWSCVLQNFRFSSVLWLMENTDVYNNKFNYVESCCYLDIKFTLFVRNFLTGRETYCP